MKTVPYKNSLLMAFASLLITASFGVSVAQAQMSSGVDERITATGAPLGSDLLPNAPQKNAPTETKKNTQNLDLQALLKKGRVGNIRFQDPKGLVDFYASQNNAYVWSASSFLSQLTSSQNMPQIILTVLEKAWEHGLNPEQYHTREIRDLLNAESAPFDLTKSPNLELLLSDAMARYARDLSGMRVEASDIGLHSRYWKKPPPTETVLNQIKSARNVSAALEGFAPQGKLYKMLQKELVKLYNTPESDGPQEVKLSKGILRPGTRRSEVVALRGRMGFSIDVANENSNFYDDELAQSVMAFQRSHGLAADGIIGPQTAYIINKTQDDHINQILVNMERLRWIEQEKPERYVIVNVPAAHLWAIENGKIAFDMKVVVGKPQRATNIFNTEITGVRLNPTWTVPPTIKKEDFLPGLQGDPMYLANKGIEVVHQGQTIDPTTVDWNALDYNDLHGVQMVQPPGSRNPLGKVRVFMSNPYNIYLHDTNQRSYFGRSNRALSSGCIRMEDSMRMANFILGGNDGWTPEKTQRIINTGRKTDIAATRRIPVYILYHTIWMGDQGQLVYGYDVYGRDALLRRALHNMDGVGFPSTMVAEKPDLPKITRARVIKKSKTVIKKQEENEGLNIPKPMIQKQNQGPVTILKNVEREPSFKQKSKDSVDLLTFNE